MEDINKLKNTPSVKYLNINIDKPNLEVIYHLIDNGKDYSYAELIDDKKGYIYVPYEIFKEGELEILDIINNIPTNLNELEIARFLYITLGKKIGYDINILPEKNETFNLKTINTINNIWGCLNNKKGTNTSFTKLYLYLCRMMNINCEIVKVNNINYSKNLISIKEKQILTDITQDIPLIQAGFRTKNFIGYNDNIELDRKINYIKDTYNEEKIEYSLKNIDYSKEDAIENILLRTQQIININNIKPIELGIIYDIIFEKYCPNYNIYINNLFVNENYNKEHFILISYNDKCYSYNYNKSSFMKISYDEILKNIEEKKIGIYLNEELPRINKEKVI